jgi:hypothetical protein
VAEEGAGSGLDVSSKEVERLQLQLDMAHGKLEALQMQQQMQQDRHAALVTRYEKQLREADSKAADTQDQLAAMAAKVRGLGLASALADAPLTLIALPSPHAVRVAQEQGRAAGRRPGEGLGAERGHEAPDAAQGRQDVRAAHTWPCDAGRT